MVERHWVSTEDLDEHFGHVVLRLFVGKSDRLAVHYPNREMVVLHAEYGDP